MPLYMKYGDVKGEVTETKHKEWLAIDSCSFGVGRSTTFEVGSGQEKRHRDQPTVSDLQVSRSFDAASPLLFNESVVGKSVKCQIDFLSPAKGADKEPNLYLTLELRNCLISSYSVGGGAGGCSESLSLNFTALNIEYTPYDDKDTAGDKKRGFFDLVTAKSTKWS